jgi:arylsulfatase A-like enzyme
MDDQIGEVKYEDRVLNGRTLKIRNQTQLGHYCINVATYKALAKWLDYLKEQGVYDNTRIILVSDHGYYLRQFEDLEHPAGFDVESLNPLLMVKDFNADGEWTINNSFMSNADVPGFAMQDVIENPVNPYTGNPVNDDLKKNGPLIVTDSPNWKVTANDGNTFDLGEGNWWTVHDNIFDMENWVRLKEDADK